MNSQLSPPPAALEPVRTPTVAVVGVGGAGLHAVEHLARAGLTDATLSVVHTDTRALERCTVADRVLIGARLTHGLGTGGDLEVGKAAAEAELESLRRLVTGVDLVWLVAGVGGGTGAGVAPVLAHLAREHGVLALALAILPFDFERNRRAAALEGLRRLKTAADAVLCLPNQKIARLIDDKTPLLEAFRIANELLAQGVLGLSRLLRRPGPLPVDFADLCRVVRGRHAESCFATAEATGENRATALVEQLLASPWLDAGQALNDADAVLLSLVGGPDLALSEVDRVTDLLARHCDRAELIVGAAVEDAYAGRLALTLVAARRNPPDPAPDPAPLTALRGAVPEPAGEGRAALPHDTQFLSRAATDRSPSRTVTPPPELTPEQTEHMLARHDPALARQRRKAARMKQQLLPLEVASTGRFDKSPPTRHRGEDLDVPTYLRRGVVLN